MKKVLLVVCTMIIAFAGYAQVPTQTNKKSPTLSISFMLNDFQTAQAIKRSSLSSVLKDGNFSKFIDMTPGFSIGYWEGITNHVDFMGSLSGSFPRFNFRKGTVASLNSEAFLLEGDANVVVKLLTDAARVNPYLTVGAGVSSYSSYIAAYIPAGAGFIFRLGDEAFVSTQFQYRTAITDNSNNHFNFQLGFGIPLVSKKN